MNNKYTKQLNKEESIQFCPYCKKYVHVQWYASNTDYRARCGCGKVAVRRLRL